MPILIVEGADPLSDAALESESESVVRNAQSDAGRVLKLELLRYCRGEVNGRSFLVAGHRGAGKTMMVADAVDKVLRISRRPGETLMRPLPIFLHGPSLFETEPARPAPELPDSELQRVALRQIILCLHRAVSKEFVRAYRQRLVERPASWQPGAPAPADQAELAAQFEIELTEDPSAARLHEFWSRAGAGQAGVLFEQPQRPDQGPRELVALNGMCNAHQRISGAISALDKSARSEDVANETRSGAGLRGADVVKPLASVLAGAAVAGGAAAGPHSVGMALVGGVVAALGSAVFFKASATTRQRSGRQLDTTFIPDLSVDTLDRILPTLIQRLRDCGLAPVLIVDELDKVSDLADRFVPMMDFMKKLVAENIFSCFVTDRSYLEILRMRGQGMAHGRASSYFTHSLLVTFGPFDVDAYLGRLLQLDRSSPAALAGTPGSPAGAMQGGYPSSVSDLEVEVLDLEVVKWVLRHRSRLHALGLAREVAALRGESGALHLPPGAVRTEYTSRVDVTFQVAIEFHLAQAHVQAWLRQRPGMTQTLLDALYYPTREWLKGSGDIAPQAGRAKFHAALVSRMNLGEVTAAAGLASAGKPLSDNDKEFLDLIVADLLQFLCDLPDAAAVAERWSTLPDKAWSPRADPSLPVLQSMLLGDESLVTRTHTRLGDVYRWRYSPTGETHAGADAPAETAAPQRPGPALVPPMAKPSAGAPRNVLDPDITATLERIQAIERNLWILFRPDGDTSAPDGRVFQLLGDRLRVLPTTPAYSRVHSAILNVNDVLNGGGSRTTLIEDGRALNGFLAMLKASTPALIHALVVAAFCGDPRGLLPAGTSPVLRGLEGLSAGLGFAALDAEQLIWAMERMQTSAGKYGGRPLAAMAEIAVKRDLADIALIDDVLDACNLGRRELPRQDWGEIVDSAWVSLRERAARFVVTEESPAASLHEILCAMAEAGPAQLIGLDLRAVTLQRWTTTFLCAAGLPLLASPAGGVPPKWMVGYALNRLGAACIDGGRLADLASWALGAQATAADANALHNAVLARRRGNDNFELSNRLALCVTPGPDAPMGAWTARPSRGMVLVVTADLLAPVLDTAVSVLKLPLLLATAQGPGVRISPEEIVQTIAGRALVDRHVWVYRQRFAQMSDPSVIGPQTADDVLDYVQALPTAAS